ncbi:MAG: hypothetical protein Q9O74_00930 [Planctomycetota bacterium]|nr:hypothetical protein [Planctomycetota bacterium]
MSNEFTALQAEELSPEIGVIDAAKLLPGLQATVTVLDALPLELVLANLGEGNRDAILDVPVLTPERMAGVKRRLEFLLTEFRAESKVHPGLHHTLIVHFRKDDEWVDFTPLDKESWTMSPDRESICYAWRHPALALRGIYHARRNAAAAMQAFARLAEEATHVTRDLLQHDDQVGCRHRWLLELYRTAWNSSELSADPYLWLGGIRIPDSIYDKVRSGHPLDGVEAAVAPFLSRLERSPSCCCHTLSEDCFTASARKIAAILDYLVSGAGVWMPGAWFSAETGGELTSDTLLKAQNSKHNPVTARKVRGHFEYEVRSVCRRFSRRRKQILDGLN